MLRHETDHDPANLSDLALKSITESHGRERRQVYFSRSNFVLRAEKEGLGVEDGLVSEQAGSLSSVAADTGCSSRRDYQALIARLIGANGKKKYNKRRKTEASTASTPGATPDQTPALKKLGRPRKTDPPTDTGSVKKRGRPRKSETPASSAKAAPESNPRQPEEIETPSKVPKKRSRKDEVAESLPKKRGRPSTKNAAEVETASAMDTEQPTATEVPTQSSAPDLSDQSAQNDNNDAKMVIDADTAQVANKAIEPGSRSARETYEDTNSTDAEQGPVKEMNPTTIDTENNGPVKRTLRSRGSTRSSHVPPFIKNDENAERETSKRKRAGRTELDSEESEAYEPAENEDGDDQDEKYEDEKYEEDKNELEEAENVDDGERTVEKDSNRNDAKSSQTDDPANDVKQINELDTKIGIREVDLSNLGATISTPAVETPTSKVKKTKRSVREMRSQRTDLSHHRRVQDLYSAIKGVGGVVEASRESYDVYQKYVHGPNFQTAPLIDKAAMRKTLNVLFKEGKLKQTTVSSRTYGDSAIQKRLIYLSDLDTQSQVFRDKKAQAGKEMMQMYQPRFARKEIVSDNIGYISLKNQRDKLKLPENCYDSSQREEVRKIVLSDVKSVARLHGYITGKFAKAHNLYILLANEMQHKNEVTTCIGEEEPIFSLDYFKTDIPLEQHMQVFPWTKVDAMALEYKSDTSKSQLRIKELPNHLQKMVGDAFAKRRHFVTDCIRILWHLNLVELMEEIEITEAKKPHVTNLRGVKELRVPQKLEFFKLKKNGLFLSFEDKPVFRDGMTLNTTEDINKYFERLKALALNSQDASETAKSNKDQTQDISNFSSFAALIQRRPAWQGTGVLSLLQKRYLTHFTHKEKDFSPPATQEELEEIAYTCGAPVNLVKEHIEEESSKRERLKSKRIVSTKKKRAKKSRRLKKSSKYSKSVEAKVKKARSRHMDLEEGNEDEVVAEQVRQLRKITDKKKPRPKRPNEWRFEPPLDQPPGRAIEDIIEDHKRVCKQAHMFVDIY